MSESTADELALISKDDENQEEDKKDEVEEVSPMRPRTRFRWPLFIATAILGAIALTSAIVSFTINPLVNNDLMDVNLDKHTRHLSMSRGNRIVLRASLGVSLANVAPKAYLGNWLYNIQWEGVATVKLTDQNETDKSAECVHVSWQSLNLEGELEDCFELGESHWYGGAELCNQTWPMEAGSHKSMPFVSSYVMRSHISHRDSFGSVLQPVWLNSKGVAIIVDRVVPLHVGYNTKDSRGRLCLKSKHDDRAYPHWNMTRAVVLSYTVCTHNDIRSLYQYVSARFWDVPSRMPDVSMIHRPIWSTWVRYKTGVNQSSVLKFANEIVKNEFTFSNFEIDDKYSENYGDFEFNPLKFPEPRQMTEELHRLGFNVTLWVYPFANVNSNTFKVGATKGFWVTGANYHLNLVSWWNTKSKQGAAILDPTNPDARQWFITRLKNVTSDYGIDSFKFDAGEVNFLPEFYTTNKTLENPGDFSASYASIATHFLPLPEVRVGYFTQHLPLFVRVMDKLSTWGTDSGLQGLITGVLTVSIMGYPFVLPDMIGGNLYYTTCPSDELFIRWAQATAFMPAMQFSLPPWDDCFNDSSLVTKLAREAVEMHGNISDFIVKLAQESVMNGSPIVRPLWWIAPNDTTAHVVNDQFLLGDHVIVAPVVHEGARMRKVYLPEGEWRDGQEGQTHKGPVTLTDYAAPLDVIPYFIQSSHYDKVMGK